MKISSIVKRCLGAKYFCPVSLMNSKELFIFNLMDGLLIKSENTAVAEMFAFKVNLINWVK